MSPLWHRSTTNICARNSVTLYNGEHHTGNVRKKLRTKSFVKGSSRTRDEQYFRLKGSSVLHGLT